MSELPDDDDDQPPLYAEICRFYFAQIVDGAIQAGEFLPLADRVAEKHGTRSPLN